MQPNYQRYVAEFYKDFIDMMIREIRAEMGEKTIKDDDIVELERTWKQKIGQPDANPAHRRLTEPKTGLNMMKGSFPPSQMVAHNLDIVDKAARDHGGSTKAPQQPQPAQSQPAPATNTYKPSPQTQPMQSQPSPPITVPQPISVSVQQFQAPAPVQPQHIPVQIPIAEKPVVAPQPRPAPTPVIHTSVAAPAPVVQHNPQPMLPQQQQAPVQIPISIGLAPQTQPSVIPQIMVKREEPSTVVTGGFARPLPHAHTTSHITAPSQMLLEQQTPIKIEISLSKGNEATTLQPKKPITTNYVSSQPLAPIVLQPVAQPISIQQQSQPQQVQTIQSPPLMPPLPTLTSSNAMMPEDNVNMGAGTPKSPFNGGNTSSGNVLDTSNNVNNPNSSSLAAREQKAQEERRLTASSLKREESEMDEEDMIKKLLEKQKAVTPAIPPQLSSQGSQPKLNGPIPAGGSMIQLELTPTPTTAEFQPAPSLEKSDNSSDLDVSEGDIEEEMHNEGNFSNFLWGLYEKDVTRCKSKWTVQLIHSVMQMQSGKEIIIATAKGDLDFLFSKK